MRKVICLLDPLRLCVREMLRQDAKDSSLREGVGRFYKNVNLSQTSPVLQKRLNLDDRAGRREGYSVQDSIMEDRIFKDRVNIYKD